MSIYRSGAEAFRDTTKWLVAFVPISTVLGGAVLLGPRLLADLIQADSLKTWVGDSGWVLIGIAMITIGIVLIVWLGANVLSAQPHDFRTLLRDSGRLSEAFEAGVGAPYFADDTSFTNATLHIFATQSKDSQVSTTNLESAVAVTDMLLSWAFHKALSKAFNRFRIGFAGAVGLIVTGFVVASASLQPVGGAVDRPTTVEVTVNQVGKANLQNQTGCSKPEESEFVAIAGTWDAPLLSVFGPDCQFAARWRPDPSVIELRISPRE
jgi:hypothetical protein